jgi:hypothetical protein
MLIQDKIVGEIRAIAKRNKLQALEAWDFSNVGTFLFQRPHDFEPLFLVSVSFQSAYLKGSIKRSKGVNISDHPYVAFMEPGRVRQFLDAIAAEASHWKAKGRAA